MSNSIKYYLVPSYLATSPNKYYAKVVPAATLDTESIIARCKRRGTTLTETDLRAAINLFMEETVQAVKEGNFVNLPMAKLRPGLNGSFDSRTDSFDSSRHSLKGSISSGLLMSKEMADASVEKIQEPAPSPDILDYEDANSGSNNTTLTPGGIGTLIGSELKFNKENPAEGVFIVPSAGGAATKVSVIATCTDGKITFQIPTGLAAGNYQIEVRKGYTAANTIRTGELAEILTVS